MKKESIKGKHVVVFGIFDGLHEGHRDFFRQARVYGNELVAIVGRDAIALLLKNKTPRYSQEERVRMVFKEPLVAKAVLGDKELSTYNVLEKINPNVICIGYDQQKLFEDITKWVQKTKKRIKIYSCKKA